MQRTAAAYSALALAAALAAPVHAQTFGLHIGSLHYPRHSDQQGFNPGVYVKTVNGLTFGAYRNTVGRTSVYGGLTLDAGPYSLTAGLISGYRRRQINCREVFTGPPGAVSVITRCDTTAGSPGAVTAFLNPSARLPAVFGLTPRLTLVPPWRKGDVTTLHFSLETSFD